ncbi:MAG TPA: PAAR domain-containing protein [Longimicrobiales bacterium]
MGKPAANGNSIAVGVDTHIVMVPTPGGPVPTPLPHPFSGQLTGALATTVMIANAAAAVKGSIATNQPPHIPTPPGTTFQKPPANQGSVHVGSATVLIAGQPAARMGDPVRTCNDPADVPVAQVIAASTVLIGG